MNKMPVRALMALAAAMAVTSPALARSTIAPATGVRIEATVGYDSLTSDDGLEGAADNIPDRLRGARVGVAAGYDIALGPALKVGVEIGVGTNVSGGISARLGRDTLRIEGARDIDVALRAGFALKPRTIMFGKVGYANSRLTVVLREYVGNLYETERQGQSGTALRVGGGVEQGIGHRLYIKAEYRWTRHGEDIAYQSNTSRHQLLTGVGMRF